MRDIVVEVGSGVATVTLNRPEKLNALSGAALQGLASAYAELDSDDDVRAIVLTGAGRAFCSGADLSRAGGAFQAAGAGFRSSPPRPLAFQLRKPVIAAVNGHAIGLGMTIALHCDIRVMAEEAKWGVVQVQRGVLGDAVSHWSLVRSIGTARAAEVLLTGRLFSGAEAVELGVANRCLPAADVVPAAMEMARSIATDASPLSVAMSKRILWAATSATWEEIDELETDAHRWLMGRPDALEGGAAASERRPPVWHSRVGRDWPPAWPTA